MKRFFTVLSLIMLFLSAATAQLDTLSNCEPDSTFLNSDDLVDPLPFINDTLGEGFATAACIGDEYEQIIFVKIPSIIQLGVISLTVTSIRIDSVTNLPPGFNYICSRPECVFPTDTASCILLKGAPTDPESVGDYELQIGVTIGTTVLGDFPAMIPDPALVNGTYILKVRPAGDSACLAAPVYDASLEPSAYAVYPNPATEEVTLEWDSDHIGVGWIEVRDLTGQTIHRTRAPYRTGKQRMQVSLAGLETGMYLVGMAGEQTTFWSKTLKL